MPVKLMGGLVENAKKENTIISELSTQVAISKMSKADFPVIVKDWCEKQIQTRKIYLSVTCVRIEPLTSMFIF